MSMRPQSVLVLGGPGAGKTHYGGQLYGRLHRKPGRWRFSNTPGDLNAFADVLHCLENGIAADHTPTETWADLRCSIATEDGRELELIWPEYGGEQLNSIVQRRAVPEAWRQRLADAHGWLLFLRLNKLTVYEDIVERPAPAPPHPSSRSSAAGWDANAQVVELLQILLATTGRSLSRPLVTPRLAVLLSCWDELDEQAAPTEVLQRRLRLVASFVEANWSPEARAVWGLSSLGRPLRRDKPDEEYVDRGPEQFGYVITPHGTEQQTDLMLPLDWLFGVR